MIRKTAVGRSLALFWLFPFLFSACSGGPATAGMAPADPGTVAVVAAENFYGDIARQLGGSHVSVTSILSNPGVDPHEYESNMQNALAVTHARLVIENGGGYDTWMDKLLAASPDRNRIVIVGTLQYARLLVDNPHVWYGVDNIQAIAQSITNALIQLDGANKASYEANLATFQQSLDPIQQKLDRIKAKYAGTPIALTETIFLYQSEPMGLKVLTPPEFQKAIAESSDPPASAVAAAIDQLARREVSVLVYNQQTVTPITTNLQDEAKKSAIPLVPVTETMPAGKTYQQWMLDQLDALQQALGG